MSKRWSGFSDKMVSSDSVRPFEEEVKRFVRKGHDVQRLLALKQSLEVELGTDPDKFVQDAFRESSH